MFEIVDGRTDGRRTDAGVTGILLAHPRAFGSGELKNVFFCLQIFFTFTNSVDPNEMHAFHLGIHCLQKYSFRGFTNTKG